MTKKQDVWLVGTDDGWEGLYVDGKAVYQNHRISVRDFVLTLQEHDLALDVDFRDGYVAGEDANRAIEDAGCLPDNFSDIEDNIS